MQLLSATESHIRLDIGDKPPCPTPTTDDCFAISCSTTST